MTKHFHVLLWIPLMYCALFILFWIKIYQNDAVSFEDYVLERQVNYAAESAVDELLDAGNLNQDYANGDFVTLEPDVALRDFSTTLCYDFRIIPTDQSLQDLMNKNLKTFVVCVYDGVYLYYRQQNETHGEAIKQSPKIPYFYTDEDSGTQYCLTLNPEKGYWDSGNAAQYKMHFYDKYDKAPSDDRQATAINDRVANLINWSLYEAYNKTDKSGMTVNIPATGETVRGEQPVRSPTVIGVVEGNIKSYGSTVVAECIGGAQLEETDQIIGFYLEDFPIYHIEENGIVYTGDEALNKGASVSSELTGKFYAKSSWWKQHTYAKKYIPENKKNLMKYFDNEYEAAKNGYNDIGICD